MPPSMNRPAEFSSISSNLSVSSDSGDEDRTMSLKPPCLFGNRQEKSANMIFANAFSNAKYVKESN